MSSKEIGLMSSLEMYLAIKLSTVGLDRSWKRLSILWIFLPLDFLSPEPPKTKSATRALSFSSSALCPLVKFLILLTASETLDNFFLSSSVIDPLSARAFKYSWRSSMSFLIPSKEISGVTPSKISPSIIRLNSSSRSKDSCIFPSIADFRALYIFSTPAGTSFLNFW